MENVNNLETQTIEDLVTQAPVVGKTEPVSEAPTTPADTAQPVSDWTMTVEELIIQQKSKEELEAIKANEQKLLEEIWIAVDKKVEEVETTEQTKEDTKEHKGDEPSDISSELAKIKMHAEEKANQKIREAEAKFWAEKRILDATVEQLQKKLVEMQSQIIEQKTNSIEAKDDLVVHYNHLRQKYVESESDPKFANELSKFHLRNAAVYNNLEYKELEEAIELVKNKKENEKAALFWQQSQTGGWWYNWYQPKNTNEPKRLNKSLL